MSFEHEYLNRDALDTIHRPLILGLQSVLTNLSHQLLQGCSHGRPGEFRNF